MSSAASSRGEYVVSTACGVGLAVIGRDSSTHTCYAWAVSFQENVSGL
jgi:hypothetical protein